MEIIIELTLEKIPTSASSVKNHSLRLTIQLHNLPRCEHKKIFEKYQTNILIS